MEIYKNIGTIIISCIQDESREKIALAILHGIK